MPKDIFLPWAASVFRRCNRYILRHSDATQLQRRSTDAVTELVLRCCVYWRNRLGRRQKVRQPPITFKLLYWWCPLGHCKWHLPAIQFILAVRFIPILTHLSSRWTVPLTQLVILWFLKNFKSLFYFIIFFISLYASFMTFAIRFNCQLLLSVQEH